MLKLLLMILYLKLLLLSISKATGPTKWRRITIFCIREKSAKVITVRPVLPCVATRKRVKGDTLLPSLANNPRRGLGGRSRRMRRNVCEVFISLVRGNARDLCPAKWLTLIPMKNANLRRCPCVSVGQSPLSFPAATTAKRPQTQGSGLFAKRPHIYEDGTNGANKSHLALRTARSQTTKNKTPRVYHDPKCFCTTMFNTSK